GQEGVGRDLPLPDEIRDPSGQGPGLARARSGHDEDGAVGLPNGLCLDGVQVLEEGGRARRHAYDCRGRPRRSSSIWKPATLETCRTPCPSPPKRAPSARPPGGAGAASRSPFGPWPSCSSREVWPWGLTRPTHGRRTAGWRSQDTAPPTCTRSTT